MRIDNDLERQTVSSGLMNKRGAAVRKPFRFWIVSVGLSSRWTCRAIELAAPGLTESCVRKSSLRSRRDYGVTETFENTDVFTVLVSPEATTSPM